jgi:Xaa-Pro aminopeptidase
MAVDDLAALIVTHGPDVRYLCGFTGSSGALAVTRRGLRLFTDGRYTGQAAEEIAAAGAKAHVEIVPSGPAVAAVQWLAAQVVEKIAETENPPGEQTPEAESTVVPMPATAGKKSQAATIGHARVGFDAGHTTVAELDRWKKELPAKLRAKLLKAGPSLVAPLRWLKDSDELAIMTEAAALGDDLFAHLLGFIEPGMSEVTVAAELEYQARRRGADGMSFESIVASGPRSALPHGRASGAKLPKRGFLTLDFGVILKGYCSDMTRTVCLGKPTARERDVYETVLAAQVAAVAAVAAGVECGAVDEAARSVLRTAGMAEAFSHSTGHGVGIEIHEGPRLGAGGKEQLAPGMVVTIEPGVYFPGEFGLRIEDMVAVTRTGGTVLTRSPKALIEL